MTYIKTQTMRIDDIKPADYNPRKISKEALKGCAFTGCAAVLIFIALSTCYLTYIFYFDDSLVSSLK